MRVKAKADVRSRSTGERLHQGLTPLEDYLVLEVNHAEFRVINDKGDPILYPKSLFEIVDPKLPPGWQFCEYADGEYYLEPIRTSAAGFYESFFGSNGDRIAQVKAKEVLREVLEAALEVANEADRHIFRRDLRKLTHSQDG